MAEPRTQRRPGVLLPYQRRWVEDTSSLKVWEKSRRIGASWCEAADSVRTAMRSPDAGGMDCFYLGYNKEMAVEHIEDCADWARFFQMAVSHIDESVEVFRDEDDEEKSILVYTIHFNSGFKIQALSSHPRSLRGRQGKVTLDEFAFHDQQGELLKAAMALLMWGGRVSVLSTHNGADNYFNQLIDDIRGGRRAGVVHRTTIDDALADGLYRRICEKLKREWSEDAEAEWRASLLDFYGEDAGEELFVVPRRSAGAYISGVLVESCQRPVPVLEYACDDEFAQLPDDVRRSETERWCEEHLKPLLDGLNPVLEHVIGGDFGRSGDVSSFPPLEIGADLVRRPPFYLELRNVPFTDQEQVFFYVCDRLPNLRAGKLDARGNGQFLAERAQQRYGSDRFEAVMLSNAWYLEHMPQYRAALQDGMVELPQRAEILQDHRAIRLIDGIPKLPNKKTSERGQDQRHGDSAIGYVMAYAASLAEPAEYNYHRVPNPRRRDPEADDDPPERAVRHAGVTGKRRVM